MPINNVTALAFSPAGVNHRWRPAPVVRLSVWWHVAGLIALVALPSWWPWILGALAANHVVLILAVMWPRGNWLGPNLVRLPAAAAARAEICLTFDDGPDPQVTPQVLDLLDRYHAKASFFCIGKKAAAFPATVTEIARRGHSVENHSYGHSFAFALYGMAGLRREIESTQAIIAGITGRTPRFFRAPAGFRSVLLDPVLGKCGMRYVSWTRRGYDAVHRDPAQVLWRLAGGLAAGDVLVLHDGANARTRTGEAVVLAVLPALLDQLAARGLKAVSLPTACGETYTAGSAS
ncbi:MAG: polysaccharide deacetylase family protein [Betaproteobacteria bacterium]|nr:polysaccharide deacetylase family protein [Betaproteobacteria bacterium]